MYKKAAGILVLVSAVFMAGFLCVRGIDLARLYSGPASELKLDLAQVEERDAFRRNAAARGAVAGEPALQAAASPMVGRKEMGVADVAVSGQRIVDISVVDSHYVYHLTEEERETLLRIVEAEAGNETLPLLRFHPYSEY